jgi:site-specific DNA recombinase
MIDTKRAAIYIRQSKARTDSISVEVQEESCRAYARQKGYEVAEVVIDEGVSGYRPWERRPNFPGLVERAEAGAFDVLLVYRWSRLSRRRLDQATLITMLEERLRIPVESPNENYDVSTAGGFMAREQMLVYSAFESKLKADQWREAHARRIENGMPSSGSARFGYERILSAGGKTTGYVVDEALRGVVAGTYERYVGGSGFPSVAEWLNSLGVTSTKGTRWTTASLPHTMDSGFAAGRLATGRRREIDYSAEGAHEPIIGQDLWDAYLAERERRRTLPAKSKAPAYYMLSVLRCGYCGDRMSSHTASWQGTPYQRVRCRRRALDKSCVGTSAGKEWLDLKVALWVSEHQAHVAATLADPAAAEGTLREARSRCEALRSDLAGIDAQLGRLASGWASGLLDDTGYRRARADAESERHLAKDRLDAAQLDVDAATPAVVGGWELMFNTDEGGWDHGALSRNVAKVIREVRVFKERIEIEPRVGELAVIRRATPRRDMAKALPTA